MDAPGAEVCAACPAGTYSAVGQVECQQCGLYVKADLTATTGLGYAPNGISCANGVLNGTLPGHWSERHVTWDEANTTRTWECAPPEELIPGKRARCLGGMNSSCAEGHDDSWPLCAKVPQPPRSRT